MDTYLDRMSHPHSCIHWDMRTWWFIQQVPGYCYDHIQVAYGSSQFISS
jgi:hypothetical protein